MQDVLVHSGSGIFSRVLLLEASPGSGLFRVRPVQDAGRGWVISSCLLAILLYSFNIKKVLIGSQEFFLDSCGLFPDSCGLLPDSCGLLPDSCGQLFRLCLNE